MKQTYKSHLIQLPDHSRANQKLKNINESIIQMPVEHRGVGINKPRKLVQIFPDAQSEPALMKLCAVSTHLVISSQERKPGTSLFFPSLTAERNDFTSKPPFLQTSQPNLFPLRMRLLARVPALLPYSGCFQVS